MLTRDFVREAVRSGTRKAGALDERDFARLVMFFPEEDWKFFGFQRPADSTKEHVPSPWTREEVLDQLKGDLAFAFEKALNKRGISAHCMYCVVKMWMWVLEDAELSPRLGEETQADDYTQYGLPFLKAVALKYDLPNPIGTDAGNEYKYSEDA